MKKAIDLPKTNSFVRFILVSSLILICITLMTGWLLWYNVEYAKDAIRILLNSLSYNLSINFNFWDFSSIIFSFAGLAFIFAIPLGFVKRKSTTNNIFSLLSLILALAIFGFGLFLNLFVVNNPLIGDFFSFTREHLIIVIPFQVTMLFSILVIISSLINLVFVKNKVKVKEPKQVLIPTKDLIKPVKIDANELKSELSDLKVKSKPIKSSNNSATKTLATIKVTVPTNGNNKDITDNIKVYQSNEDVKLDLNISD